MMTTHAALRRLCLLIVAAIALAAPLAAMDDGDDLQFDVTRKYPRTASTDDRLILCTRVARPPKIDATLEDREWDAIGRTTSAFTSFPDGKPTSRQTIVSCGYDDRALYVCFDCEEKEPEEQRLDEKDIAAGDHVGLHLQIDDTRGRGVFCSLIGNRVGYTCSGPWRQQQVEYKCAYRSNRWIAQMAIPFAALPGSGSAPARGEVWGVKFTRYGRATEGSVRRMQTCWPVVPAISYDVVTHEASLCFDIDGMLENGDLAARDGAISGWTAGGAPPAIAGDGLTCAGRTFAQRLELRPGKYTLSWRAPETWDGAVVVAADGREPISTALKGPKTRIDFAMDAAGAIAVQLTLNGHGAPPALRLRPQLDDVPAGWLCLTNNDWWAARDVREHVPDARDGRYTYLRHPLYDFGFAFYRSCGCPEPGTTFSGWSAWGKVGAPTRPPLDAPPPRPDIGEDQFESFPFETIYSDDAIPEMVGFPNGAFDIGGVTGWIPFSHGSLTGDDSWAGWAVDRWAGMSGRPHDIVFDLGRRWFIRRIDILQIKSCFRNVDIHVRGSDNPDDPFVHVYRDNGSGTGRPEQVYGNLPPYVSIRDIDSVASQVRISLTNGDLPNKFDRPNCGFDVFGVAEVWIWAEPQGTHGDDEIKAFKPVVPAGAPPLVCQQLRKLPEPIIWPRPKEQRRTDARCEIARDATIACAGGGAVPRLAEAFAADVKRRFLRDLCVVEQQQAGRSPILVGLPAVAEDFARLCRDRGVNVPVQPQGYALTVDGDGAIVAGADVAGVHLGLLSLAQWMDHDERAVFLRGTVVRDWPRLGLRTITPSTDHRQPIMPFAFNERNWFRIVDAIDELRFNALSDHQPARTYGSVQRNRELIGYAADRQIEVRPVLSFIGTALPGACVENRPDDQSADTAGMGPRDGTWETANLCPSNPRTYALIDDFLDRALATHLNARYVDLGFLGSDGAPWNTCPLCRRRGLTDGRIYADFLNRLARACADRGATAVITNAFMFGEGPNAGHALAEAFGLVSRATMLRFDRTRSDFTAVVGGFWSASRPWESEWALRGENGYRGGAQFYKPLPPDLPAEGMLHIGEAADWWWWSQDLSDQGLLAAEEFWNGPAPGAGDEVAAFDQLAANACVRFNERRNTGIEYPSWRTGLAPRFFPIDIRAQCTRSHIDQGSIDGPGRSGPKEGMLALGPSIDFSRLPLGAQRFADVPFTVIDPAANGWKSIVVVGSANREALIPGSVQRTVIPVGRKAASVCALRCLLRREHLLGGQYDFWGISLPAYVLEYADGTRYVCDREQARHFSLLQWQCFHEGESLGGTLRWPLPPAVRPAWFGNTLGGEPANLFLSEFVNPYPEKEIRDVALQFPNAEQRNLAFGYHEALFALTGVEPTEWDVAFWRAQPPQPLVPADAAIPVDLARGIAEIAGLREQDDHGRHQWRLDLRQPADCGGACFRLSLSGGKPMPTWLRHADCTIEASTDGASWEEVARVTGCSGMDGEHVIAFPRRALTALRFRLDSSPYVDEEAAAIGVLSADVYAAAAAPR